VEQSTDLGEPTFAFPKKSGTQAPKRMRWGEEAELSDDLGE
jgi:hypothetical protein